MNVVLGVVTALIMLPVCATASMKSAGDAGSRSAARSDVIARVGDQTITFREINTAMNSSGIVGVSIPAVGTPQRDTTRIVLLDRFVSANLLYLDALKQGSDRDPGYQKAVTRFSSAILAGLYRQRNQAGDIPVSDEEIEAYYRQHVKADTELTDDLRLQIEATLRRQKLHERLATADRTLRDSVKVVLHPENLSSKDDATRADSTPLAEVGTEIITWGQIGDTIITAGKAATIADPMAFESEARRQALEREVDLRIMVQKAKAAGLEDDPVYRKRVNEYRKTRLINLHRRNLVKNMEPSEDELEAYYQANRQRLMVPEARKVQMVVVKTRKEARSIKDRIEAGDITMYEAARDYSIAAGAKRNLGEVGWVNQGEVVPALGAAIFSLEPGKLGGPVESPAGWHLVKALEVKDSKYSDFADEATRKLTRRRYLHEKVDAYTAQLRKNEFSVVVYQDRLVQLEQQEADMVKELAAKAEQPGSVTQQRIKELRKLMKP